jgi:serine/threonine-protein kinase
VVEASLIGRDLDNRYRLLEVIGEGGMGRVFRAEQLGTGRTVALKLLHPQFSGVPEIVQRFEREAEVTTRLSHPHIVKMVEFGKVDGRLYLATEFLPGRSLADLLDTNGGKNGGRLTVRRAIAVMRPVLSALEYAHRRGVVHRDLKPENIMVVPARGLFSRESVKLLDFGIAKLGGDDAEAPGPKLTQLGLVLGTPGYMSPEQAAGQRADVRSDLYSCGVILYEMLAGRRPFEGDNLQVLAMHLNATPRPLREIVGRTSIPSEVEAVVSRALAKRPEERFQSARELRRTLDNVANIPPGVAGVSGIEKTILATPPASGSRAGWMRPVIVAFALALLIGEHLGSAASRDNGGVASTADRRSPLTDAQGASKRREGGLKRSRPAPKRHSARP